MIPKYFCHLIYIFLQKGHKGTHLYSVVHRNSELKYV